MGAGWSEDADVSSTATATPTLPGPPLVGHLGAVRDDIIGTFERAARLGDVTRLRFPMRDGYVVNHPDGVKRVLLDNVKAYGKRTRGYDMLSIPLGKGLVTSEGALWKRQRRIAQPAFHHRRIRHFVRTMDDCVVRMLEGWHHGAPVGSLLQTDGEMMKLTLEIVGRCLMSTDLSDASDAIGDAVSVMLRESIWRVTHPLALPMAIPTPHNLRMKHALRDMHGLVDGIIEQRRAGESAPDLLDMLMQSRDELTGEHMTDAQLKDEVMTMVSAGHETTALALTWTLYYLSVNPEVRERLEAEVDAALDDETPLEWEDLERLPYTQQVIEESMRLRPPVWMLGRSVDEDDVLLGHPIPKGSMVFVSQLLLHRDPRFWDDPERFDPDRFASERARTISKHLYFPFAGGPRVCIGSTFAMMEAKILLARIVRATRLESVFDGPIGLDPTITLRPKGGLLQRLAWR